MKEKSIDSLLRRVPNKFLLVNALAGRAKQIMDGSLPYVEGFNPEHPIDTAIKEIIEDRIKVEQSDGKKKSIPKAFDFEKEVAPLVVETLAKKERKKYSKKS